MDINKVSSESKTNKQMSWVVFLLHSEHEHDHEHEQSDSSRKNLRYLHTPGPVVPLLQHP